MRIRHRRAPLALGVAGALLVPLGVAAHAVVVSAPTPRAGSLVQVGPIVDTGYPTWYRDSNGIRLEGCWTLDDPLCPALPDTVPDPDASASYPDNFPVEHFYQLAAASVSAGQAGTVDIGMDLEGAWANEVVRDGDQMVFGRIRIRAKDAANGEYRITHPYGVDEFVATGGTGINMTEDVGGSPYGTDFVRVERRAADGTWQTVGSTDLFTVQGRLSRNDGVDVQQATYRTTDDGTTVVEVFASSEAGEAIRMVAPELGYKGIGLVEDSATVQTSPTSSHQVGRYYGRYAVKARRGRHRRGGRHEDRRAERRRRAGHDQDGEAHRRRDRVQPPTTTPSCGSRHGRATPPPTSSSPASGPSRAASRSSTACRRRRTRSP